MKQCSRCKETKSLESFSKKGSRLQPACKDCNRAYQKNHYQANKQAYLESSKANKIKYARKIYQWRANYLATRPCIDCGESDIRVLQFDHIDPKDKLHDVSYMVTRYYSLSAIEKEAAKCEVRCANCHIKKTGIQFNWYNFLND